jgi:hypothetical protein
MGRRAKSLQIGDWIASAQTADNDHYVQFDVLQVGVQSLFFEPGRLGLMLKHSRSHQRQKRAPDTQGPPDAAQLNRDRHTNSDEVDSRELGVLPDWLLRPTAPLFVPIVTLKRYPTSEAGHIEDRPNLRQA